MARGTQLQTLVDMLKDECRLSPAVSVGVGQLPSLKNLLRRTQEWLYQDYDWSFLRIMPAIQLQAGERYYDFPEDMNMDRVEEVAIWWNGQPEPVTRGIGFREYSVFDSDSDERSDPVLKWDVRWTGTTEQMEVWPLPASNDPYLQLKGIRKLRPLISDTDVADLDDQLIVLHAAAEWLTSSKAPDAQAKLATAKTHYSRLKGRSQSGDDMIVLGSGDVRKYIGTVVRVR